MQLGYPMHSGKIGNLLDMENTGGCSPPSAPSLTPFAGWDTVSLQHPMHVWEEN